MAPSAETARPHVHAHASRLSDQEFAVHFERASRTLWCVAFAILRDRELSRDVVQESAIVAMRKLGEFDASTSFNAWMSQIVRYTAMNEVRRRSRRRENAGLDAAERPGSAHGHHVGLGFDQKLTAALETLDETARACLLMKIVMGLEYRDISDAMGIPEGTAMSHVFRARKALRERLGDSFGLPVAPPAGGTRP
ncbi:MAG TPA: sigma-70 family RNA polymerase sigma factor [Phycisphaerales bacterium]|nr:sigma-70 family RNA polymerase sigma factor [Phycisphaerales bacterium]